MADGIKEFSKEWSKERSEACLEAFPQWLASLNEDTIALATLLVMDAIPDQARRHVAGALQYLSKSLDLIPDGIEDLGYLDDAFVLRVASSLAVQCPGAHDAEVRGILARLAAETELIEQLLDSDYPRLVNYVRTLEKGAAHGRSVQELIDDSKVRNEMIHGLHAWSRKYQAPSIHRDEQTLIKLKSFLSARLS